MPPGPRPTREQRAVEREILKLRGAIDSLKPSAPRTQTSPIRMGSPPPKHQAATTVQDEGTNLAATGAFASPGRAAPGSPPAPPAPPTPPTPPTALEATDFRLVKYSQLQRALALLYSSFL